MIAEVMKSVMILAMEVMMNVITLECSLVMKLLRALSGTFFGNAIPIDLALNSRGEQSLWTIIEFQITGSQNFNDFSH